MYHQGRKTDFIVNFWEVHLFRENSSLEYISICSFFLSDSWQWWQLSTGSPICSTGASSYMYWARRWTKWRPWGSCTASHHQTYHGVYISKPWLGDTCFCNEAFDSQSSSKSVCNAGMVQIYLVLTDSAKNLDHSRIFSQFSLMSVIYCISVFSSMKDSL